MDGNNGRQDPMERQAKVISLPALRLITAIGFVAGFGSNLLLRLVSDAVLLLVFASVTGIAFLMIGIPSLIDVRAMAFIPRLIPESAFTDYRISRIAIRLTGAIMAAYGAIVLLTIILGLARKLTE